MAEAVEAKAGGSWVIRALAALAQERRLEVFRRLVVAGPEGLPAGAIAALIGAPAPTLSFHLKELEAAGLVRGRRAGRSIRYSADYAAMRRVLTFLMEDCCQGHPDICAESKTGGMCVASEPCQKVPDDGQ